ncbi:MAG: pseudouridine synthase [Longimicrobiales bacterium]|nr:pseudouridine synthase [Longimicrobiales bacterium]
MRLQKFLSRAGVASRREAERMMLAGRVTVNGEPATELGTRVESEADLVAVDGEVVKLMAPRWLVFHKPVGVLTTRHDPEGRPTVYDVIGAPASGLRYVGRLDYLTSGLILLTNQGEIVHRLTHPSWEIEREYRVEVEGAEPDLPRRLVDGVILEEGPARAKRAEWGRGRRPALHLVLAEGRNREVRRMIAETGCVVRRLTRVRYGPVRLGDLPSGSWRDLTPEEIRSLREVTGSDEVKG